VDGTGLPDLLRVIQEELYELYAPILVKLPYQQGALISLFHEAGQVERIEHERGGVLMQGRIPGRLLAQFSSWQVDGNHQEPEDKEEP
jgi:GTP-binding protein HflX